MIVLYLLLLFAVAVFLIGVAVGKTSKPIVEIDIRQLQQKIFDETFPNNMPEQKHWVYEEEESPKEEPKASSPTEEPSEEVSLEPPKSEIKSESSEESDDIIVPITVADDEYIAPPMAKSSIKFEEEPADDDDIIKDEGESSYYSELAKQQAQIEVA